MAGGAGMSGPGLRETLPAWAKIGLLSFGGPAAQIALMHRVVVDEKGWLTEKQYLNALSFCMLLPGPEAMQLATYAGWRINGVAGGLAAGLLFVLPGAFVVLALAMAYLAFGDLPAMAAVFFGIKSAVLVIVLEALLRVARKGLVRRAHWVIAGLSFLALFSMNIPFPVVILLAGLWGLMQPSELHSEAVNVPVSLARTARTILLWLGVWLVPLVIVGLLTSGGVFWDIGLFFSKLATVTFGGAYAVLAYMAQDAVQAQGWLTAEEMLDGLGLAETTPGPLILVTEFVGVLAAARSEGGVSLGLGALGALVTLWVTFAPCFLWIFAGAPYVEWIASRHRLREALAAISAAVVGVILNLSIWFGLHVLFADVERSGGAWLGAWVPQVETLRPEALALTGLAAAMLLWRHWSVPATLAVCAVLGLVVAG